MTHATDPATIFEAATDTAVRLAAGHAINVLRQRLEDAAFDENPRRAPAINAGAGLDDDKPPRDPGEPDQPNRADPTGEEALRPSRARSDQRRLMSLVDRYDRAVEDIVALCKAWAEPSQQELEALIDARNDELKSDPDDEWCKSCIRVGVTEPVTIAPDGEPYYAEMCRWCGQTVANLKTLYPTEMTPKKYPPKALLKIRHEGRRVYDSDIREALGLPPVSGKKAS